MSGESAAAAPTVGGSAVVRQWASGPEYPADGLARRAPAGRCESRLGCSANLPNLQGDQWWCRTPRVRTIPVTVGAGGTQSYWHVRFRCVAIFEKKLISGIQLGPARSGQCASIYWQTAIEKCLSLTHYVQ
ncbi:Piso0_005189 [Millerozyma farinosa CBS 7064]|uniref:Piso0_005189 protein n=1 Tax=Pichia sorbitophila (strain ATCC MYA-4447 / BCRC 22081 / CBS 7064 / NBRC 10061 / NRRL Y-12695) TaxID=559304 RepID=G8Y1I3_PICSO|nr:Piso0_005189 [Millerozyma farinosa CBS 7064]